MITKHKISFIYNICVRIYHLRPYSFDSSLNIRHISNEKLVNSWWLTYIWGFNFIDCLRRKDINFSWENQEIWKITDKTMKDFISNIFQLQSTSQNVLVKYSQLISSKMKKWWSVYPDIDEISATVKLVS